MKQNPQTACLKCGDLGGVPYEVLAEYPQGVVIQRADGKGRREFLLRSQLNGRTLKLRGRRR